MKGYHLSNVQINDLRKNSPTSNEGVWETNGYLITNLENNFLLFRTEKKAIFQVIEHVLYLKQKNIFDKFLIKKIVFQTFFLHKLFLE